MKYKIALIRGDGIGPEVVGQAVKVMERVGERFGHTFEFVDVLLGGCATDAVGKSYPDGTAEKCKACDAVLLGAVGGPKWGADKPAEPAAGDRSAGHSKGSWPVCKPAACRPAPRHGGRLPAEKGDRGEGDRPDDGAGAHLAASISASGTRYETDGQGSGGHRPDGILGKGN